MRTTESKTTNPSRAAVQPHFSTQGAQHSEAEANFFSPIQAKLEMGQPGDRFEQEADSVADQVVQRLQDPNLEQETIETPDSTSETAVQTELAPEQEEEKPVQLEETANVVESVAPEQATDVQSSTQSTAPLIQKLGAVSEEEASEEETQVARKELENSSAEVESIVPTKIETKDQNNLGANNSDTKTITPTAAPNLQTAPEIKEEEPIEEEQSLQKKAKETTAAAPPADEEEQPPIQPKTDTGTNSSFSLPSFESQLSSSRGGGTPLPNPVQRQMGTAFKTDFSPVRIHTDSSAVQMSRGIGARAFTHGADIYFNQGEYNPGSRTGQHLLAHELTHTLQQGAALQRKLIQAQPAPDIQASLVQDALSALGNIADRVPGYRLFSVLIQHDLIRNTHVEFNAENLVDGLMSLIPFGHDIFLQLQQRGILRAAFDWINANLQAHDLTGSRFQRIWDSIIDIPLAETFSPIDFANAQLRPLLNDAMSFARAAVDELMRLIKEALKGALREVLAENQAYLLITKILHYDPVTDESVNASTVEILEDFLRLIGKETELEQMREKRTLEKTAEWIDGQLNVFMSLLQDFQGILSDAWAAIQPENLPNIAENLQSIATRFGDFLSGVWDFATTVAAQVLQFIKDALLSLLREHASSIRGYRLFTVILGKDPVTEQPVERNARNIIAGFVELVAGIEQYQQMEQTGAIDRMAAWVDGLISRYGISVEFVRNLFLGIWDSLTIDDLVHPVDAFERVVNQFREPIIRLLSFALEVIKKLIEVLLEVMNFPSEIIAQIIQRATQAIEDIQRDPVGFLLNLLRALKQGFAQFFDNIGTHLVNGLVGWLTSELQEAGIQPPRDLSLQSIIAFVLDVLGISMERIWQKLAEHPQIGPERVARVREFISRTSDVATGVWAFIQDVQREGIGAIWRHIQEQLSNLWDTVLGAIQSWITERIVNQMVTRLLSMLDPTGIMAVVNSFIAFYRAVQSFIEKLRQILEVINSFVGGIAEIARGTLTTAANFLERTLASSLPVIIGFLANQVGLRGLGTRIGEMIERVRALVDQALTWLVNRAVQGGMALFNRLMGRTDAAADDPETQQRVQTGLALLDTGEAPYLESGKITREEAEQVATQVRSRNPVFSELRVVDGGENWNYSYRAGAVNGVHVTTSTGRAPEVQRAKKEDSNLVDKVIERLSGMGHDLTTLNITREDLLSVLGSQKLALDSYQSLKDSRIIVGRRTIGFNEALEDARILVSSRNFRDYVNSKINNLRMSRSARESDIAFARRILEKIPDPRVTKEVMNRVANKLDLITEGLWNPNESFHHVEIQSIYHSLETDDEKIRTGVNRDVCERGCKPFLSRYSRSKSKVILVADPHQLHIFHPSGPIDSPISVSIAEESND